MRKLVTLFVFLAIAGVTTACGESLVGVEEIDLAPAASHDEECQGWPYPNSFFCDDGEG